MTSVYPGSGRGDSHPVAEPRPPSLVERLIYPEWGPLVAGGIAAAALALALHTFAVGIGLSVASTAPTWRDTSFALVLLSALYVVLGVVEEVARKTARTARPRWTARLGRTAGNPRQCELGQPGRRS
jgi:hypothetical protein